MALPSCTAHHWSNTGASWCRLRSHTLVCQRRPQFSAHPTSLVRPVVALLPRATFPKDGFQYLSAESVERIERELEEAREQGLAEYQELKDLLLKRTWRFGTLFALYLLLTASAEVCATVGTACTTVI